MSPSRVVLVTAASGHIGEVLIPRLAADSATKLVLPTTNATGLRSKLANFEQKLLANVFIEEGSIQNPAWLQGLLDTHKVDTVFLCLTGEDELFTTLNFIDCLSRSKYTKKLIYLSGCGDYVSPEAVQQLMRHCSSAHVLVKILAEQKLVHGQLPFAWTVLQPTLFFVNDLRSRQSMLEAGVFNEPLGEKGVSRVALSDIAEAVSNIVLDDSGKWNHKHIPLGSRKMYKGGEIAALWSSGLEKTITMRPADEEGLQTLERELTAALTGQRGPVAAAAWGRDIILMYQTFAAFGFGMSEEAYQQQVELLGHEPADYGKWVKSTAASWLQ